jgi:hypothetical protein
METTSTELMQNALYRLLFDCESRERARRGDWAALALDPEARDAFEGIDFAELQAAATKIQGQLLYGKHGDASGLARCYERSLAHAQGTLGRATKSLIEGFVASEEFRCCSDVPFAGAGTCPEEGLYRFLLRETGALPDSESWVVLRHELLEALLQALTVSPSPSFIVRERAVRRDESRYWAIESYPSSVLERLGLAFDAHAARSFVLYASAHGQYVTGLVPSCVQSWLEQGERKRIEATFSGAVSRAAQTHAERWLDTLSEIGLIR